MLRTNHIRFKDPEYTDNEVEGLMRYFHLHAYEKLAWLLKAIDTKRR